MRLVDANMAPIYLNSSACEQIKRIPTVEAIPVEWIKSWAMKNWVKSKKCEFDIIASKLIDDWLGEENETNR